MQTNTNRLVPLNAFLGAGFRSRTQEVKQRAVTGETGGGDDDDKLTWDPQYAIEYVNSYTAVNSFYSMSASARYSGATFSGAASVAITRSEVFKHRTITLALRVRIATRRNSLKTAFIEQAVIDAYGDGNYLDRVLARYGDRYITSLTHGGEVAALLFVTASSEERYNQLLATAEGKGWGASGRVATLNMVKKASEHYSVVVKYSQQGGKAPTLPKPKPAPDPKDMSSEASGMESGSATASGFIETDTEGLLAKLAQFELDMGDRENAAVVPISMLLAAMDSATGWPGGDLDQPYPPEVENIAETLDMLQTQKDEMDSLIREPKQVRHTSVPVAHEISDFLDTTLTRARQELSDIIANKDATASMLLETLNHSRLRRELGVQPGNHPNAGLWMDANSADKMQLREHLLGPRTFPDVRPWPTFDVRYKWGYMGEDANRYGTTLQYRCEWSDARFRERVRQMFTDEGDGVIDWDKRIFTDFTISPVPIGDGGKCGYHELVALYIAFKDPDGPQLTPLDDPIKSAVADATARVSERAKLISRAEGQFEFRFAVTTDVDKRTSGAYTITVIETNGKHTRNTRRPRSYWVAAKPGPITCIDAYEPERGWTPQEYEVALGTVLALA